MITSFPHDQVFTASGVKTGVAMQDIHPQIKLSVKVTTPFEYSMAP
jgi:hypothetical protein